MLSLRYKPFSASIYTFHYIESVTGLNDPDKPFIYKLRPSELKFSDGLVVMVV